MKKISVKNDYGTINISNLLNVNMIIEKIKQINLGKEICLDLKGCLTDYPNTPKLVDYFLKLLEKQEGKKVLCIIYTGIGTKELHVLHDFVLDGEFFRIKKEDAGRNNLEYWIDIINKKLKEHNIELIIDCPIDNAKYKYG